MHTDDLDHIPKPSSVFFCGRSITDPLPTMDSKITVTIDFQDATEYTSIQVAITCLRMLSKRHGYDIGVEVAEEAQAALNDSITKDT